MSCLTSFSAFLPKVSPYESLTSDELASAFKTFREDSGHMSFDGFCRLLDLIRLVDGETRPLDSGLEERLFVELFGSKEVDELMFSRRFNLYWCARGELYDQRVHQKEKVIFEFENSGYKQKLTVHELKRIREKFIVLDTERVGRIRPDQLDEELLGICRPYLGGLPVIDWSKLKKCLNQRRWPLLRF